MPHTTADVFFSFHRGQLYVIPNQWQQEVGRKKEKLLKVTSAGGTIAEIGFISPRLVNQQQKSPEDVKAAVGFSVCSLTRRFLECLGPSAEASSCAS